MKYFFSFFALAALFIFSCKTVKKTEKIQEAITKKDTAPTIVIRETPKIDSAAIIKSIMSKVVRNKIDFKTLYLSMKKDSIIIIKVSGTVLGISKLGVEAQIKKDSVIVVQHVGDQSVTHRSISYLQEVTKIPFNFTDLQEMLIGNPVFIDSNIVSYKAGSSQLLVLMVGDLFKHLLTLDNNNFTVLHSKLDDVDIQRNRTGDITFSNYQPMGIYRFATYRKISVAENSKLDIYLDFKEFTLNEPLKYSFELPKKSKRK
jgi:hypothetical protein